MKPRIDYSKASPEAVKTLLGMERYLRNCGLEESLLLLVKMRSSQMNGCAYCLDMHSKDARALGETEQRLYGLDAWRESPYYTDRERAALAWIEALTLIREGHVEDEVFEAARKVFSEQELVDLSMVAVAINGWNRIAIAFRAEAGSYQPQQQNAKTA